jgi:hypothetical protein
MATPSVQPIDPDFLEVTENLTTYRSEVTAYRDQTFLAHQTVQELKSRIHHNRVVCSEGIAEIRQRARATIGKH